MARRTATINKKPERAVIIGAGITEKYYFSHLQSLYNLKIKIRPRYFGNENISTLEKLIKQQGRRTKIIRIKIATFPIVRY
mgnify:CR=1 FL=1